MMYYKVINMYLIKILELTLTHYRNAKETGDRSNLFGYKTATIS